MDYIRIILDIFQIILDLVVIIYIWKKWKS